MFKFFYHYRFTSLLILNTILVFSNQLCAQEGSITQSELVAEGQPALEEKLIRVRRKPPKKRGPTPKRGSVPSSLTTVRNTSPIKKRSSSRTPSRGRYTASSRNNSPLPRSISRKRTSPTAAQASPPKQVKIAQKPVALPPAGRLSIHAPTPTESNDRYKLLRGVEVSYKTPITFSTPTESAAGSRNFRLQWRVNNNSNAGMEHILKRHTREYHDGSFKKKQSMFPQGTTHIEIKDMVKEVVEHPQSVIRRNAELGLYFRQIEGSATCKGNTMPLVVGYRESAGPKKPLDIVQAYPKGIKYEVDILPSPARKRRGIKSILPMPMDLFTTVIQRQADQEAQLILNSPSTRQLLKKWREERETTKALSLKFLDEENEIDSFVLTWEAVNGHTLPPPPYTSNYTLMKNRIATKVQNDSSTFTDQPDENALTTCFIRFQDSWNNLFDSEVLEIGTGKITNLKAAITSNNKICLSWDPIDLENLGLDWDPIEIEWAVSRNSEILDISGDANAFEDEEVEANQVYIYRIMAFIREEDAYLHRAIFYSKPLMISTEQQQDFEQDSFLFHTYLLEEAVTDLEDLNQNPETYYTSIEDKDSSSVIVQNSIIPWEDNTPVEMLNGRIDVEVNGHSLVSCTCFDNVRILWDYLLAMVEQYLQTDQATIYFPGQSIPISLNKKSSGIVEFQIDDQFITIGEKKCLIAILQGAEQFFTLLNEVSIDKYSSLLQQIRVMQNQVRSRGQRPQNAVQTALSGQAKRISMNRVLLSWIPSDKEVKKYEILLNNQSIITLPADKNSYTHIFQPKEQEGICIYKIISYDQNDKILENYFIRLEIEGAYLEIQKNVPPKITLNWGFSEQNLASIGYYQINRNGSYLGVTDITSYEETPRSIGKYTYEIKALDHSMHSLTIEPIIIEKTASNVIELNWRVSEQDKPLVKHYQVYRNEEYIKAIEATTYIDNPSDIGKYTYKILVFDQSGNVLNVEPLIKEIEVMQEDLPQKPPVVQGISHALVRRISANEVLLNWIPNSAVNIKSYEVLINDELLATLPANNQQYTHNIQQTEYLGKCTYKLIAYDNEDKKLDPYSIEFEIIPSYLQVKKIVENVFELNWEFLGEGADAIEFYNVYRDVTSLIQVSKNVTTFSDTTLLAPGTYTYKVEVLDESGSSLEIQPAIAKIVVVKEDYLQAYVNASNIVKLRWEFLDADEERTQVYRISRDDSFIRYVLKGQSKEFVDTLELEPGEYTYTVEARDSSGNTIEVKQVDVRVND